MIEMANKRSQCKMSQVYAYIKTKQHKYFILLLKLFLISFTLYTASQDKTQVHH